MTTITADDGSIWKVQPLNTGPGTETVYQVLVPITQPITLKPKEEL